MPFTFAHPAAVLPFMRQPLAGFALVAGAIAPDIPYYLRATPLSVTAQSWYEPFTNATTAHSIDGIFPVTLPLALTLALAIVVITPPSRWLAHGDWSVGVITSIRATTLRKLDQSNRSIRHLAWLVVAFLIGISSHLLWDSLTSSNGLLAQRFESLNNIVAADLSWIDLLAHLSSVVGLMVVVYVLWRRRLAFLSNDPPIRRRFLLSVGIVIGVALVAGVTTALLTVDSGTAISTIDPIERFIRTAAVAGGACIGIVVMLTTLGWWTLRCINNNVLADSSEGTSVEL